jgi:hypothetical protein
VLQELLSALRERGASVSDMDTLALEIEDETARRLVRELGQAQRNVFRVAEVGFVNVHVSTSDRAFWGVDASVKKDFDVLKRLMGIGCVYVLLVDRNDNFVADGYILNDLSGPPLLRPMKLHANVYRINARDLDPSKKILSIGKVAKQLVERLGQP